MAKAIISIAADHVVVCDPDGISTHVPITLTPKLQRLSHTSQKNLLATGCLFHFCAGWRADPILIRGFLNLIRNRVIEARDSAGHAV